MIAAHKIFMGLANNRVCNYHLTEEYTPAAIEPLLRRRQSAQVKVKFPSSAAHFSWPFRDDVLKFPPRLQNQLKYNHTLGRLKILTRCAARCYSRRSGHAKTLESATRPRKNQRRVFLLFLMQRLVRCDGVIQRCSTLTLCSRGSWRIMTFRNNDG